MSTVGSVTRALKRAAGIALVAALLTACSSNEAPPAGEDLEPQRGGVLRMQLLRDTAGAGYDPAKTTESTVYTVDGMVFDTLLEAEPDGTLVPSLAEKWTISDDKLVYTFTLRSGVKFHDGSEMTSEDVKFTIDRILDPETQSPRRGVFSAIEEVTAPDPTTVVITLSKPYSPLLNVLADITAGIVPKSVVEEMGEEFGNAPVGTGPFKWERWRRDQEIVLTAHTEYWQPGLPYLDGVTISYNADANARAANIRSGTIDFLWNAPPELYTVLTNDDSVQAVGGTGGTSFQYFLLNSQKEPFSDVRVRQAIFTALDREQIRMISRPDTTVTLPGGFLPPGHWAAVTTPIYGAADLDKARSLLADAGESDGFSIEIMALTGSDFHIRTAQAIQQQLEPLGITVTVSTVDSGQQRQRLSSGEFDAVVTGFSGSLDPDERLTQTFGTGGGTNYAKYSDPKVDALIAEGRLATEMSERAEIYREVQKIIAETGPMAFTYNYNYFDVMGTNVHGYVYNPSTVNYRSVRQMWIEQD